MYLPRQFAVTERAALVGLMRQYPFATLLAVRGDEPEITHLPLLVAEREGAIVIEGHLARANPLAAMIEAGTPLTAIFQGPHAYVSARHYRSAENVPTWNYAVVHARGRPEVIRDPAAVLRHLHELSAVFESGASEPWLPAHAGVLPEKLLPALVTFEFRVERLDAKFKLSQNRNPEDRAGVLEAFERGAPHEQEVAALMKQHPPR